MEPDPIGLQGGLNPYNYALGNPVIYVDTTGTNPVIVAMGVGAGISGGSYVTKVGIRAFIDAKKNNQSLMSGIWDNFNNSFSGTELGQEMVVGAAFGGIGKAAFLAADVHLAKTTLSTGAPISQKLTKWINNAYTNKVREYSTMAGLVVTGNLTAGKISTSLMLSSYNDQRSMQQMNMQLNQQLLNQQYQMNSQFS